MQPEHMIGTSMLSFQGLHGDLHETGFHGVIFLLGLALISYPPTKTL